MSKERPWEAGPFEQWVIDELDYRKKSLSTGIQGQFTGDLSQYAGPRKAWARVFSNGMVQYPNSNAIGDTDNEWGLAFLSGDGFFDRYGIGSTSPYGVSKQVYGYNCKLQPKYIESSTRPNIPDPGIISIETEIQKSWFAKAKINWTCHSIEQLKAITPYFLTPLQNVIIEFGWNTFDKRSLINLSNFNQILDAWDNHYRRYSQSMPLSKGNYEFLIGQVINFEYTINDNIITGMTEVASRQLLYSGFKKDSKISKQTGAQSTFKQNYKVLVDNIFNSFTSTDNQGNNSAQFQIASLLSGLENKYGGQFTNIKDHIFSGRDIQKIKYSHERDFDHRNKKGEEFTWLTMDLIVDILNGMKNSDGIKEYTEYFFDLNIDDITIGAHDNLISIKETILIPNPNAPKLNSPYNVYLQNSYQPNPEDAAGGIIDNIELPFGLTQTQEETDTIIAAGDSGVGNLNNAYTDKTKHKFFKPEYGKAHSKLMTYVKTNLADKQLHNATGASTKVHRQDLNYILNNWGRTNSRQNTAIPAKDQTFGGKRNNDGLKRGYLKNIYVNLKFLKEVLLTEQNNNIKEVYDVICAEINKSSCNFWELNVVDAPVENGKSTLKIVDGKGPPNKNDAKKIYKFEYMTNNSIIKKLNFTTNLSNAQANQIMFKAGTYDYTTSNQLLDYTNVTNLSNSKKPEVVYSDRIIKTKAGKKELTPNKLSSRSSRLNVEDIKYYYTLIGKDGPKYKDKFLQVTLFDEKPNPDSRGADTITDFETYDIVDIIMPFEDLVLYMLNDGDLKTNTNIYNAPLRNVEIEISLMGISGIKTFEFFRIANLPPPFNDDVVVFQVMNVTHVVNENTWETRVKAQLRPAYNLQM